MNAYFVIILAALVAEFLIGSLATLLNLGRLRAQAPEGLEDVYQPGKYAEAQEYARTNMRFDLLTSAFKLAALLVFWFLGMFNTLDVLVTGWGFPIVVTGVLYIGLLLLLYFVVTLPFSVYATFGIESRFGFNKTTPSTFALDRLKGLALSVVVGAPLLAAVLAFFHYAGDLAWLYAWAALTVATVAMQYVAPAWILPLFNKFSPLEEGELRESILAYARSVNFSIENILVMDGSKRSSKSNAVFTGFGRNKRIALFDTLIDKHTVSELVSVLAHEIGHYKKKHILQGMLVGVAHSGILFFLLSFFLQSEGLFEAFGMEEMSVHAGLALFVLLYTPIGFALSIVLQHISRRNEYAADRWSVETYGSPQYLAGALKKLAQENFSNLAPHPFFVLLNNTHPPLAERIRAINGAGGELEP